MGCDVKSRVPALFGIVKVRLFDIGLVLWGTNDRTDRSEPATDLQAQLGGRPMDRYSFVPSPPFRFTERRIHPATLVLRRQQHGLDADADTD